MSRRTFASRHPTVARLLGIAEDEQQREDEQQDGAGGGDGEDEQQDGDEGEGQDADGDGDGGEGDGGEGQGDDGASAAALADLTASERTTLIEAFDRDSRALVRAEQTRCVTVFAHANAQRAPNAAARLLSRTNMSAKDVIDTLGDMGATSRATDRARLQGDSSTRPRTGVAEEAPAGSDDVRTKAKARRKERNANLQKKGGVKANRTEFDVGDDA